MNISRICLTFSLLCLGLPSLANTWIEGSGNIGDAQALSPGQDTIGNTGSLTSIQGRFEFDDVDVYRIRITDVQNFKATTVGLAGSLDTQLFLFNEAGKGVTFNDDDPATNSIQSTITGQFVPAPGIYYLAVTQYNRDAISGPNLFLWANEPFNVERVPDGNSPNGTWSGWSVEALLNGTYEINLTGADFATVGQTPPPPQENHWAETSDAPQFLPGQKTYGEGLIVRIDGSLATATDVDIYEIMIDSPQQFHASTVGEIDFDSQLYLFDSNGKGVTFNDDDPAITGSWSIISGTHVLSPGIYYLAITKWDQDPVSATGEMWMDLPSTVERIPDGPGAADPLLNWNGQGVGRSGQYSIQVRGAKFSAEGFTLSPPNSYNRVRGTLVSGTVAEMSQSDNVYGVFAPGVTFSTSQDPILLEFDGALPTTTPAALELLVETRGTTGTIRQIVGVWDFVAQSWVDIDTSQLTTGSDLTLAIDISNMPNVINPSGKVRARVRYKLTGPALSYPWRASIDQIAWRLRTQ